MFTTKCKIICMNIYKHVDVHTNDNIAVEVYV